MDGGMWHCTGDRNQDHPQEKKNMQKSKMAVWGGLTNSCEKKGRTKEKRKLNCTRENTAIFNSIIRESITENITLRPKRNEQQGPTDSWAVYWVEETVRTKTPKEDCALGFSWSWMSEGGGSSGVREVTSQRRGAVPGCAKPCKYFRFIPSVKWRPWRALCEGHDLVWLMF